MERGIMRSNPSLVRLPVMICIAALLSGCSPGTGTSPDLAAMATAALSQIDGEIELPGLTKEVEVLRDRWGVPHIYARNLDDLFFAQGFVAAQDRLWQLEMWRRWLEGRSAEIAGPDRIEADRMMRLLAWRQGLTTEELNSYHPESKRILRAFAAGVNAFIEHRADNLPVEFQLTGVWPEPWTAATSTLRSTLSGVGGSLTSDLRLARRVAELGAEEANRRADPDPFYELVVPHGFDPESVTEDVLDSFLIMAARDIRVPVLPQFEAVMDEGRTAGTTAAQGGPGAALSWSPPLPEMHSDQIGSNNWVISGELSASGMPMLANDPHRSVTNPSLRYLAHLSAPGWEVIGSGEPALPGIAIGHNERIAWGLTIVGTDQIDVFVEQLDPEDTSQVRYGDAWEPLRVEREVIAVRGSEPLEVDLEFSRHGPIVYKDEARGIAFAVRSFAQEPGTAPYLGSLRVDQVTDCREFLQAMRYWLSPSENMICGDLDGNIAWRASALTPGRSGPTPWYGRLPVPGSGEYEWGEFRDDVPEELNPERGWIATANHNIQPPGFHPPIMFLSGPPYRRFERVAELLERGGSGAGGTFTIEDFQGMQHDAFSATAAEARPLFEGWTADEESIEWARQQIAGWDCFFRRSSTAAALYMAWTREVDEAVFDAVQRRASTDSGSMPAELQSGVSVGLDRAMARLTEELGPNRADWRWGRLNLATFEHPVAAAYDLPTAEKSGGAGTVYANGATFREIFDLADWDAGLATTAPGQSGQPGSPFYGDLIESWANGDYFPLAFSREAVVEVSEHRLLLRPAGER
jgi:penicillin amidase